MSLKYLTRRTALTATTKSASLTNFNHLRGFPRSWVLRQAKGDPKVKSVRPQDRIKYWNIVPGDQIRLRGDPSQETYEVLSINRLSNRVFVKGEAGKQGKDGQPPPNRSFHYSKCQLFVGDRLIKKTPNDLPEWTPVYASRIGTSRPVWDFFHKRWSWRRYAVSLHPKPETWYRGQKIRIPWPEDKKKTWPEPTSYDTPRDVVAEVTYKPPHFGLSSVPEFPSEQEYLDYVYNPHLQSEYDSSKPFEVFLATELSNPHSRAKKLQRHKLHQSRLKATYLRILQNEQNLRDGRPLRQVRADAAFKFRELVKAEKEKKKKARWMHVAAVAERERKANKKAKKEERLRRRLNELVLHDALNQVIPKAIEA